MSLNALEEETSETKVDEVEFGEDHFEEEVLHQCWDRYFEENKEIMSGIEYSILKKRPTLKPDYVLDIIIQNGVEINILKKHEEGLLRYLRTELNNGNISINHILQEIDEGEKLYTDMDKFNDMAKRNPVLLKLKDKLGLDPEY